MGAPGLGVKTMKVLWIEDHARAGELLAAAATAASRKRYGIDLVIATSLMDAERKLRLERFDLVVIDLMLPDSTDEDTTVTRIASMGKFRVAIVSASERLPRLPAQPDARRSLADKSSQLAAPPNFRPDCLRASLRPKGGTACRQSSARFSPRSS